MKTWRWLLLALWPASVLGQGEMDREFLLGTWVLESATSQGGGEPGKGMHMIVTKGQVTLKSPVLNQQLGLRLDPTQKPKTLDFMQGEQIIGAGIYRIEGDQWIICFVNFTAKRPSEFDIKNGGRLWIFKRLKS